MSSFLYAHCIDAMLIVVVLLFSVSCFFPVERMPRSRRIWSEDQWRRWPTIDCGSTIQSPCFPGARYFYLSLNKASTTPSSIWPHIAKYCFLISIIFFQKKLLIGRVSLSCMFPLVAYYLFIHPSMIRFACVSPEPIHVYMLRHA